MSRKLDAAIAEGLGKKVRMLTYRAAQRDGGIKLVEFWDIDGPEVLPNYSTDGNAMLELIGEAKRFGFAFVIRSHVGDISEVRVYDDNADSFLRKIWGGENLPNVVARAWYEAKTKKEWSE